MRDDGCCQECCRLYDCVEPQHSCGCFTCLQDAYTKMDENYKLLVEENAKLRKMLEIAMKSINTSTNLE